MKNYLTAFMLLFFASFSSAQKDVYKTQWNEVEKLENEGLTKSASKLVNNIYDQAKIDGNSVQRIKALLFQSKYLQILEEDSQLSIINNFKTEIKSSDVVTKHILENILANLYWQYFKQNRYKFFNRSKTAEKVSDDFRTWDLETLFAEIHTYFRRSLQNGLLLQQESLNNYKALLTEVKGSKVYRPTLYDFLNYNALDFYKTSENSITQPTYKFVIEDSNFIAPSSTYISLDITSIDSVNLQLNALKIYQNLLRFHQKDKTSKAFISANISRLNFVKQYATFNTKEVQLINTYEQELEPIANHKHSALYSFEIASQLSNLASNYNPNTRDKDNNYRWYNKKAIDICNTTISKFPDSDGARKCEVLKAQILTPSLNLKTESHIPINQAALILVNYKNLDQLNFEIYKVSKSQQDKYNRIYDSSKKLKFLKKLKTDTTFISNLKNESDYQNHSTEIILPALKNGLYLLSAFTTTDVFSTTFIQVTDMALVEVQENDKTNYQVINRNDGYPIPNVKAEVNYSINYNRKERYQKTFTTDKNGRFYFEKGQNRYNNISVRLIHDNDKATFGNSYINRKYEKENNTVNYQTHLITDRSIYRPRQTIYFKGIATKTENKKTTVAPNYEIIAALHDVNGQKISEHTFITNNYGSFHGEFILPNSVLTGNFSIQTYSTILGNASTSISVEEYKRPKFETEFLPITKTYKVNDSITIRGNAIAFAGSTISNAKVVYRVKRNVQLPQWYYWRYSGYPNRYQNSTQEIAYGEIITDNKGEFEIKFKAQPDKSISKDNLPVFDYEITADVTDINGETRSATTIVHVGYHALIASIEAPQRIDKNSKDTKITINTSNLNGESVSAKGTLNIYKLKSPDYVLRQRPWQAPDYKLLSKTDFKTKFPHWAYDNEHVIYNWGKEDAIFSTDFDTNIAKDIPLKRIKKWKSGAYVIVLESKDKFGQHVKDEAYTFLFSEDDKTLADNKLFDVRLDKESYTINDTAKLTFGSTAERLFVTIDIEKDGVISETQIHQLNNITKSISLPITSNDVGGFVVHYSFSAFNAFETGSVNLNIPYPKTDLQIETSTFRDKLQPGEDETWRFKIKGAKGDKVAAEILASMYDASLDQFRPHNWSLTPIYRPNYYSRINKANRLSYGISNFRNVNYFKTTNSYYNQSFDNWNWFGLYFGGENIRIRGAKYNISDSKRKVQALMVTENSIELEETTIESDVNTPNADISNTISGQASGIQNFDNKKEKSKNIDTNSIQIRKNLNETAFFFPQLQTDKYGNVSFNFKAPEALTKWKLQLLAHTKTLESAISQYEVVTQKELMVIPNTPRFLRQGDIIKISSKIANLSEKALSGEAQLIIENVLTGKDISQHMLSASSNKNFSVDAKGNTQTSWTLNIPDNIEAIQYKIIAKSKDFSDGEQSVLPILTNRLLVTETLPMWVRSNETKTFKLDRLANNTSTTLKNHKLTLEITSNPAWYAIQALPYLIEYPYDCNEQTFSRYYANALAQHITKSNPRIEAVFNQWRSTDALLSNLEKNSDLKSILIEETPWLRDAQSETEQKKRIALLFDLNKMNNELQNALRKLKNNQHNNGAWPWFNGGRDNRYITQHIVSGFGHLKKLNVLSNEAETFQMIEKAIQYLDKEFVKAYKSLKRYNSKVDLTEDHLSYIQLHYLYARSFYPEIKTSNEVNKIMDYYKGQIKKYWLSRSLYAKGLMALTMHRNNDNKTAIKILTSLKENSITSDELGMYWKENTASWYWHQAPIETQALMVETFSEIENNTETIDNLKIWLLKNKQTNKWKTTKATTEAIYALLLEGSEWLDVTEAVEVTVGDEHISTEKLEDVKVEAGTGYYKTAWNGNNIKPEQAKVILSKKGEGIAWGALYWQYFEDLDNITSSETPLKIKKKLFLKTNTDKGEEILEITKDTKLNVGNLVKVRIELRSDRDMEFLHLKDMRAAGFEPINVISQYKWQDGLGYYESTKDAATNFFIDYLPKGIYIFEYDLRVNNAGDMSNGITTIQSMYAPEFSSHSKGIRINVN